MNEVKDSCMIWDWNKVTWVKMVESKIPQLFEVYLMSL